MSDLMLRHLSLQQRRPRMSRIKHKVNPLTNSGVVVMKEAVMTMSSAWATVCRRNSMRLMVNTDGRWSIYLKSCVILQSELTKFRKGIENLFFSMWLSSLIKRATNYWEFISLSGCDWQPDSAITADVLNDVGTSWLLVVNRFITIFRSGVSEYDRSSIRSFWPYPQGCMGKAIFLKTAIKFRDC